ncbi:MAG TPA: chemotaxis protein CheW [Treponemataceae bacterium]|mgnify:CR=1 FL=1|nr:chemotaxis protein CheW [Treponemataceae bacterium]
MAEQLKGDVQDELLADDDENEDTQANKYLFFRIDKESYGIGIKHVIEIIELQNISAVPDMPDYVKGVINLRGKVIPIVDLRLRFGMDERGYDNRTCIIVTEVDRVLVGCLVDTVEEVMEIPEKNVEVPPQFKTASGRNRYISGMGKVGESIKILLDVEEIVRDEKIPDVAAVTA